MTTTAHSIAPGAEITGKQAYERHGLSYLMDLVSQGKLTLDEAIAVVDDHEKPLLRRVKRLVVHMLNRI